MKDIVITAGSAVGSVLALATSIRSKINCRVFVICTDLRTSKIIGASKFVDEVIFIKQNTELEYINSIKEWWASTSFDDKPIFYFTNDSSCYFVDNHREWFESKFELCLPSSNIIQTFTEKGKAEVKAQEAGLFVPKTQIINNAADIDRVVDEFVFPVILKPRATYLKNTINFKTKIIENKENFTALVLKLIVDSNTLLCQEFIPGGEQSSFYYLFFRTKEGLIYENMGRKVLQAPPEGGIMAKGLVEYNSVLAEISKEFLNEINYIGIGGIEYKKHNKRFYFIEMSVRLEGFFKIAEISGTPLAVFSYYHFSDLQSKIEELEPIEQENDIIYTDIIITLITRLNSKKYLSVFNDVFSAIFNSRVRLNVFNKKDIKPFLLMIKEKLT